MSFPAAFSGSVPKTYHTFLGPMIFEDYAKDMARRLAVKPGERVLELACGTGIVTQEILRTLPAGASLVATDLNEAMIAVARPTLGADPRVALSVADACALPFGDGSFDAMACQSGLMFVPDKVKALQEARRVLKPGGRYVFNVWDALEHNPISKAVHETLGALYPADPPMFLAKMPFGWSGRAEIERVCRAGGFATVTLETVGFPCVAASAADAARAWIDGTPLSAALVERGVSDSAPVRAAVEKVLAERFGEAPCRSTMRAVVVTVL